MEAAKATCALMSEYYAPGMKVLDVGCGSGHYLRSLRKRLDPAVDYTGIDTNEHYIHLAQKAFPGESRFFVGDSRSIAFADSSFDIVLCINVIPNIPPPLIEVVQELTRVARGCVLIRCLFSQMNYIIKEITPEDETELLMPVAMLENFVYNNMYTESYYRRIIDQVAPDIDIKIIPDEFWQSIDNRPDLGSSGTKTQDGRQIAGQLILDWNFILLTKTGEE
jgi:ubiquinone/menaquinone biosynthesis C-methylase UbiE